MLPVMLPPSTELWSPPDCPNDVVHLKLAPGTASGYKGVKKNGKKWDARLWVPGKGTRVVWHDESPQMCAYVLRCLELYPCRIHSPKKGRAKPGEGTVSRARRHHLRVSMLTARMLMVFGRAASARRAKLLGGSAVISVVRMSITRIIRIC